MPKLYQFSCPSCQKVIEITERHAGTNMECPFCDQSVDFPGMREIRQLPAKSQQSEPAGSTSSSFNETKSWLFSAGLLVAVIGGLLGFALANYASSIAIESTVTQRIEYGNSQIHSLPSGHLWEAWDQMTEKGLPDWQETRENRYNKQSSHLTNFSYGLYGMAGLGLLCMVSSFFIRR